MASTRIINIELAEGSDISDSSSPPSKAIQEAGKEIVGQNGIQGLCFGTHVEHASTLTMVLRKSCLLVLDGL
jgi:hypothetical protein